jgi:hypothetical protein
MILRSILSAVECPHCQRIAVEDYYCYTDEKYVCCYSCGYRYAKTIVFQTEKSTEYKEEQTKGFGVFLLVTKLGDRRLTFLNDKLMEEEMAKFSKEFLNIDVDQQSSYLVTFENGIFTTHFGNPAENFHLSFIEYKEKVDKKWRDFDGLVPING